MAASVQAQSLIPELDFKQPELKTGGGCREAGQDGAVYIFRNVGWGIDALVTILGRSSQQVTLSEVDAAGPEQDAVQGTGFDNAWQPRIKYADGRAPAHQQWWMEFRISFVKHDNHETPVSVNQFIVSGFNIDGDGNQLHEFQSYYKVQSFSLEHPSIIFTRSVRGSEWDPLLQGKRFDGTVKNYSGISISSKDAMVRNFYTGTPDLIVRLGAETGKEGSVSANRMYGLLFGSLTFDIPAAKKQPANWVAINQSMR